MTAGAQVPTALVFAALMLASAFVLKRANPELAQRVVMVLMGLMFAWTGNLLPLRSPRRDDGRDQAATRFQGWSQVLAGLACAVVWVTLPTGIAAPLSAAFLVGGAVAAVIVRFRLGLGCAR